MDGRSPVAVLQVLQSYREPLSTESEPPTSRRKDGEEEKGKGKKEHGGARGAGLTSGHSSAAGTQAWVPPSGRLRKKREGQREGRMSVSLD